MKLCLDSVNQTKSKSFRITNTVEKQIRETGLTKEMVCAIGMHLFECIDREDTLQFRFLYTEMSDSKTQTLTVFESKHNQTPYLLSIIQEESEEGQRLTTKLTQE